MRNVRPFEEEVVMGLALFSASESAEKTVSADAWNKRAMIIDAFLAQGYEITDIAYPTTSRDGEIEFRFSDRFLEFMVTYFLTTAIDEFYEDL